MADTCSTKAVKTSVAVCLLLNMAIGVFVIVTVTQRLVSISQDNRTRAFMLKKKMNEIFIIATSKTKATSQNIDTNAVKNSTPPLEFLSLLKPVYHLSGLKFGSDTKDFSKTGVLRHYDYNNGSDISLMWNGMLLGSGTITVPASGNYMITSHVQFYVRNNKKSTPNQLHFQHSVIKYGSASKSEDILARNYVGECKEGINDGAHLKYPSNINVIANFNAGDEVYVRVSHLNLLKDDRAWYYFGGYLI